VPTDPGELLAQQLKQLRQEYLRDSTERVAELRRLRSRLLENPAAALADLRHALHRLAGSGGSYGFPDVSTRSREGEHLAMRLEAAGTAPGPADLAAIDQCIDGVDSAFAAARATLGG